MSNLNESLPIYVRIITGLEEAILSGEIKEEEQLPSTTYIANKYEININTVNKAVNALVDNGLVYKKRGIGMFVKKGAVKQLVEERRQTFKKRYIAATLIEAKRLNYTVEELQQLVVEAYQEMNEGGGKNEK